MADKKKKAAAVAKTLDSWDQVVKVTAAKKAEVHPFVADQMSDIPFEDVRSLSPADVAQLTYGDQTGKVLGSRLRNFDKLSKDPEKAKQVDRSLLDALPSYDWRDWQRPLPHFHTKDRYNAQGITRATALTGPLAVGLLGDEGVHGTLDHESAHVLEMRTWKHYDDPQRMSMNYKMLAGPKKQGLIGGIGVRTTWDNQLSPFTGGSPYNKEMQKGRTSIPYEEVRDDPTEFVSRLTPAVRHYYRETGRTVDTDDDVEQALGLYEKLGSHEAEEVRAFRDSIKQTKMIMPLLTSVEKSKKKKTV
jgi:hypothetical protein